MHVSSNQFKDHIQQESNYIMHIQETDDGDDGEKDFELVPEICPDKGAVKLFDAEGLSNQGEENIQELIPNVGTVELLGIASLAGSLEILIEKNKKISCRDCQTIFEMNEKIDVSLMIKNAKSKLPCKSTFDVCKVVNTVISRYLESVHISHFDYLALFNLIESKINYDNLYIQSSFDHCIDHKPFLVKLLIEEIIRFKCYAIARSETLKHHEQKKNKFTRSSKIHDIHFTGQ